jgi:RNA polymerase sigma factor (sigma-70 family)
MTRVQALTTEDEAIAALRRGESGGLDVLVELHQAQALRLAYSITGSRATAEDVVADAFVSVYQHIGQLDPDRPFRPWFTRIVANRALTEARRATRTLRVLALLSLRPAPPPDPEAVAEQQDLRRHVVAAVRSLPPNERVVIVLRYFEDMDERGMAGMLGWPVGTVKTRLYRARRNLRARLTGLNELWACSPTGGNS